MLRSLATVSGFTLISRILGFVRDMLVANYLGASMASDAWVAAFRLPNLFRRVFGEGAFNSAFVPLYSRKLEEEGSDAADHFAGRTLSLMAIILAVISVLAFIFMEPLTRAMNWGYEGEKLALATSLSRITVSYLFFICLMAGIGGVLNSRRIFGAPAFAYVVLNVIFLIALGVVVPRTGNPEYVLAWSVAIAGVVQLAIVIAAGIRKGVRLRVKRPTFDSDTRRLGLLMGPGLISAGIQQLNLLVGQSVASFTEGGQSVMYYADRVNQLPLGLLGVAFGVVLLPEVTRRLRGGDPQGAKDSIARGIEFSLLLTLPATIAMVVIPEPVMQGIFSGGKFTPEVSRMAGQALMAFGIGAPAYVLARVLQTGFFGREDTKTPMRYTLVSAVINIALCFGALFYLGKDGPLHLGCALATSIAGWVNVVLLTLRLHRDGMLELPRTTWMRLLKMLIASVGMGAMVYFGAQWLAPWIGGETRTIRVTSLLLLVTAGAVAYFGLIFALKVTSPRSLKSAFRRG
jgi:putative peptidoglycan lipid II flippase